MIHLHEVRDQDTHYRINPVTMEIEDNGSGKNELNLGDHNSEIYTFELPRVIEGHDMTLCNLVQVHFINIGTTDKSKDVYTIIDMEPAADDADTLVFSWPVSGSATMYSGNLNYRIKFACLDESGNYTYRKWSDVYKGITVGDGFDNGEGLEYTYSDILAQWEARLDALEQNGGGSGSGGLPPMFVHIDEDTQTASHTSEEICKHIDAGGTVYISSDIDGIRIPISSYTAGLAYFDITDISSGGFARLIINANGDVSYEELNIGDISTALDHIIALQEELIGL